MNDKYISIESHYNRNPHNHRNFTVKCFAFPILTTVTSTPSVVRNWLFKIRRIHRHRLHKLVVGLGVQWRPSRIPGFTPPAATLQLCVGRHCLVFQLLHANSVPLSLRKFLSDQRITFVGVWNHSDRDLLRSSVHKLLVSNVVDIRHVAAKRRGLSRRLSMETLAEILLGADNVTKSYWTGRSAWDAYWLREDQVQYACVDAYLSFSLGKELTVWNWDP